MRMSRPGWVAYVLADARCVHAPFRAGDIPVAEALLAPSVPSTVRAPRSTPQCVRGSITLGLYKYAVKKTCSTTPWPCTSGDCGSDRLRMLHVTRGAG
jgi:hypothetical protein